MRARLLDPRALVSISLLAAACGPAPQPPPPPSPSIAATAANTTTATATSPAQLLPDDVDLQITLRPEPSPRPLVRVTIAARPGDAPLVEWTSTRPSPSSNRPRPPTPAAGSPPPSPQPDSPRASPSTGPRAGVACVTYAGPGRSPRLPGSPRSPWIRISFEGAGEALLLSCSARRQDVAHRNPHRDRRYRDRGARERGIQLWPRIQGRGKCARRRSSRHLLPRGPDGTRHLPRARRQRRCCVAPATPRSIRAPPSPTWRASAPRSARSSAPPTPTS